MFAERPDRRSHPCSTKSVLSRSWGNLMLRVVSYPIALEIVRRRPSIFNAHRHLSREMKL